MDDNRTQVEFPVGKSGQFVKVKEPTDAQRLVLALSRVPAKGDVKGSLDLTKRVLRVLEVLAGDQWFTVIEEGLLTEQFTVPDVVGVVEQVATFDWAGARTAPGVPDDALQQAIDREEARQVPAPRVVGA